MPHLTTILPRILRAFLGFCEQKFASLRSDLLLSRGCNFELFQKGLHELRIIFEKLQLCINFSMSSVAAL